MLPKPEAFYQDALYRNPWPFMRELWCFQPSYEDLEGTVPATPPLPPQVHRWKEYRTPLGRIDVLLAWHDHVVAVELKRDYADEKAVAQVLRYLGSLWCLPARWHRAALVAPGFTPNAIAAAGACDVQLIGLTAAGRYEFVEGSVGDPIAEDRALIDACFDFNLIVPEASVA